MTNYTVILGRIGDDSKIYTVYIKAGDVELAIENALLSIWREHYFDVYDDQYSMAEDGYDLYGLFEGHLENLI